MQLQMFEMGIFWVIPMKDPGLYSDTSLSRHSLILTIACYGTSLFQQKSIRKYFSDTPLYRDISILAFYYSDDSFFWLWSYSNTFSLGKKYENYLKYATNRKELTN